MIPSGAVHPPLARRTPARNEDFFDPDELAELRAYSRPLKRVTTTARVAIAVLEVVAVFVLDLGPRVAGWFDGAPWPVQVVAVAAVFGLIAQAVDLPVSWWVTMVHDRRHGMSDQSPGLWIGDQLKEAVLGIVLLAALLVPVYWAIRNVDQWWLVGGLAFLVVALVLNFLYPVLVMPRFNRFTPMPDGALRQRVEEIAAAAGTRIEGVYTMDGSRRSRRGNAFVAGFGPTKRVVVYDTLLDHPLDQIAQVVAHEIGHYRLNHIPKTFPLAGLTMLVTLAFTQWVGGSDLVLDLAGVDHLGEPGAVPVFLLAVGAASLGLGLVSAWLSRRNEREADLAALELLRDPTNFVAMWPALVEQNKADLEPNWWERLNASHPAVAERMQFGLDWAEANGVDVRRPDRAGIPNPASDR